MKSKVNPLRLVRDVLHHARPSDETQHRVVESVGLDPRLARLREFQCARIARTYRDFTAQPQYAPVMNFFLSDLYGARDYTQRDHDAERVHNFLSRFVPQEMLKLSTDAIQLTRTSHALDETLLRVLVEQLNFQETLTDEMYAEAYRRCNNYAARQDQIELLMRTLRDAAETAHMLLSGPTLRMAKAPAYAAGWQEMYDFLERGHHAFAKLKNSEAFLNAIEERETKIMQRIARRAPDPFAV